MHFAHITFPEGLSPVRIRGEYCEVFRSEQYLGGMWKRWSPKGEVFAVTFTHEITPPRHDVYTTFEGAIGRLLRGPRTVPTALVDTIRQTELFCFDVPVRLSDVGE